MTTSAAVSAAPRSPSALCTNSRTFASSSPSALDASSLLSCGCPPLRQRRTAMPRGSATGYASPMPLCYCKADRALFRWSETALPWPADGRCGPRSGRTSEDGRDHPTDSIVGRCRRDREPARADPAPRGVRRARQSARADRAAAGRDRHRQGARRACPARQRPARRATRSSTSTAPRSRRPCSRPSCSASRPGRSPMRAVRSPGSSRRRRAARCSSTRSTRSRCRSRASC